MEPSGEDVELPSDRATRLLLTTPIASQMSAATSNGDDNSNNASVADALDRLFFEGAAPSADAPTPVVVYVAIFVTLGGFVVAALTAFLVWYWCRRLATRDKRLLEGRCVEGAALTEAQKKEALFKEIRRDIAAVENDGFLRHLEVYMLPQYHQQGTPSHDGWECPRTGHYYSGHGHHPAYAGSYNRQHSASRHSHNRNSNHSSSSHSQAFLVTSPRSTASSSGDATQSLVISRSATMTTTASSISSYSSSASSSGSGSAAASHRNHIPKRIVHHDDAAWGEEEDDGLVNAGR